MKLKSAYLITEWAHVGSFKLGHLHDMGRNKEKPMEFFTPRKFSRVQNYCFLQPNVTFLTKYEELIN